MKALTGAIFVTVAISCCLLPLSLFVVLLWKRTVWNQEISGRRLRTWQTGLGSGILSTLTLPLFLLGIQFLPSSAKNGWFITAATGGMFYALLGVSRGGFASRIRLGKTALDRVFFWGAGPSSSLRKSHVPELLGQETEYSVTRVVGGLMSFQSTPVAHWPQELVVAVLCCAGSAICCALLFWKKNIWFGEIVAWRQRLWLMGLVLDSASCFAGPFFLRALYSVPRSNRHFDQAVVGGTICVLFSMAAAILLAFGKGRLRWLGLLSACLTYYGLMSILADVD